MTLLEFECNRKSIRYSDSRKLKEKNNYSAKLRNRLITMSTGLLNLYHTHTSKLQHVHPCMNLRISSFITFSFQKNNTRNP